MLACFNRGDMHQYEQLCSQYADVLNDLPAMVENERNLREKITILCLTELIFKYVPACCQWQSVITSRSLFVFKFHNMMSSTITILHLHWAWVVAHFLVHTASRQTSAPFR